MGISPAMTRTSITDSRRRARRLGLLSSAAAGLALIAAACGATTAAPTPTPTPTPPSDAYAVVSKGVQAPMDHVKDNLGINTTGGTSDISIDPSSIEAVIDTKAGKGTFHLSLPKTALGTATNALPIPGDKIELDAIFDGTSVYAKSPLAASLLPLLLLQSGQPVPGDLTGWIKLGTAEELAGLAGGVAGLPGASNGPSASSAPDLSSLTPDQLKQRLEEAGITVTYAGSEQHNGVDADHMKLAIDPAKLAASDITKQLPAGQLGQVQQVAGAASASGDLWFDKATGRITEADLNLVDKSGATTALTILVSDPGNVSIEAPANATELPLTPLLKTLMNLGGGLIPGASTAP